MPMTQPIRLSCMHACTRRWGTTHQLVPGSSCLVEAVEQLQAAPGMEGWLGWQVALWVALIVEPKAQLPLKQLQLKHSPVI